MKVDPESLGTPIDARLPQPVTLSWPERTSSVYKRVNIEITGNISGASTSQEVWRVQGDDTSTPGSQYRWKLRGGILAAVVTEDCTGTGTDILFLSDAGETCIVPVGILDLAAPAGSEITDGIYRFDLGVGMLSRKPGNALLASANDTIGNGVIRITGVVWGEEVSL